MPEPSYRERHSVLRANLTDEDWDAGMAAIRKTRERLREARAELMRAEGGALASGYYAHLPYPARHALDGAAEARAIRARASAPMTSNGWVAPPEWLGEREWMERTW